MSEKIEQFLATLKIKSKSAKVFIEALYEDYPNVFSAKELYQEITGSKTNFSLNLTQAAVNSNSKRKIKNPLIEIENLEAKPFKFRLLKETYDKITDFDPEVEEVEEAEVEEAEVEEAEEADDYDERDLLDDLDEEVEDNDAELEDSEIQEPEPEVSKEVEMLEAIEKVKDEANGFKICKSCGDSFKPKNSRQKYCKKTCRQK